MMSSNLRFAETLRYDTYTSHSYSSSAGNQARIPRRRKRPSNRTRERKPMSRYDDYSDSIDLALDTQVAIPRAGLNSDHSNILIPSTPTIFSGYKTAPSPMMRKNFDQSWSRWKEREFKREMEEMEAMRQRECERKRVFGGECGVGEGVDDVLLCPKMLEVVRFLFGGDIDFGYLDSKD